MVGQVFAESLATARKIPFVGVNHLAGHIASVVLTTPSARPPFLSLLVSGGHSSLYRVKAWNDIELLCETGDDAVGEAFDKVAKLLGLPYPGGPQISRQAEQNSAQLMTFVKSPTKKDGFSYSGLKTAVLTYVNKEKQAGREIDVPFVAASFQHEAVMQLVDKCVAELQRTGMNTLCVCGGVAANKYLREKMKIACEAIGAEVHFPAMEFCTDNAAMIAAAAILGVKINE